MGRGLNAHLQALRATGLLRVLQQCMSEYFERLPSGLESKNKRRRVNEEVKCYRAVMRGQALPTTRNGASLPTMSGSRIMTVRRIYGPERGCPLIRTSLWRSDAVVVVVVVRRNIIVIIVHPWPDRLKPLQGQTSCSRKGLHVV